MTTGQPQPHRTAPWGEAAVAAGHDFVYPNPTGHPSQADDEGRRMTAHLYRARIFPALFTRIGATSVLTATALTGATLVPVMTTQAQAEESLAMRAYHIAQAEEGAPFRWGATGPYSFDCSGLTRYAYKRAGANIPRTAEDQYDAALHIRPEYRRVGDLVFFHYGPNIYHVGFYAGRGRVLHAPKAGNVVRLERIWSHNVWYGRVDDDR